MQIYRNGLPAQAGDTVTIYSLDPIMGPYELGEGVVIEADGHFVAKINLHELYYPISDCEPKFLKHYRIVREIISQTVVSAWSEEDAVDKACLLELTDWNYNIKHEEVEEVEDVFHELPS